MDYQNYLGIKLFKKKLQSYFGESKLKSLHMDRDSFVTYFETNDLNTNRKKLQVKNDMSDFSN